MQKFIVKYGLAAHLAMLVVAPLFLFPMFSSGAIARALLWLALVSLLWMLMEPSLRGGEILQDARRRAWGGIRSDSLFWCFLLLIVVAAIQDFNSGVSLSYNSESSQWALSPVCLPFMPASVSGMGFLPLATVVAGLASVVAVRNELGRSARMAFLLGVSILSGIVLYLVFLGVHCARPGVLEALSAADGRRMYVGFSAGLALLVGTISLLGVIESEWHSLLPLPVLAITGSAVGLFCFSPAYMVLAFGCAELLLLAYSTVFAYRELEVADQMKFLAAIILSLVAAALSVGLLLPSAILEKQLDAFATLSFFPPNYWESRAALSAAACKTLLSSMWLGIGVGSTPLDFRLNALPSDWSLFPLGTTSFANGWWQLLAERGLIGMALFVLPFGLLLVSWLCRFGGWVKAMNFLHPGCLLFPLALGLVAADGFFDCSVLRADSILTALAVMAASVRFIQVSEKGANVR